MRENLARLGVLNLLKLPRRPAAVLCGLLIVANIAGATLLGTAAGATSSPIAGSGSSFASIAVNQWVSDVANAPYDLSVNYTDVNSGTGRYEFANQTVDFAVTDIGFAGATDATPPSFSFDYVPLVGEGIAFMYNIPGLTSQLRLSSATVCGLLTGGITNWDSPALAADNPGVTLPNLTVVPVTESDSSVTNVALEQWCIAEQPSLWDSFVQKEQSQQGGPTDGVSLSTTAPNPNWPGIKGGLDDESTSAVAGNIKDTAGAVGAVQAQYAQVNGFDGTDPTQNVALVQNASGDYTAPTPLDVTSALAYATPADNGLQDLNFNGLGPNVYNPSTFSYLLTPTTGSSSTDGQTLSAFVNFALTLGQQQAPSFGYARLAEPLEHFGIDEVAADVPGAVPMTSDEQAYYDCGDLTPSDVAAGSTAPACVSSPGTGTPEVPYAAALPALALGGFGIYVARRRRISSVPG